MVPPGCKGRNTFHCLIHSNTFSSKLGPAEVLFEQHLSETEQENGLSNCDHNVKELMACSLYSKRYGQVHLCFDCRRKATRKGLTQISKVFEMYFSGKCVT